MYSATSERGSAINIQELSLQSQQVAVLKIKIIYLEQVLTSYTQYLSFVSYNPQQNDFKNLIPDSVPGSLNKFCSNYYNCNHTFQKQKKKFGKIFEHFSESEVIPFNVSST